MFEEFLIRYAKEAPEASLLQVLENYIQEYKKKPNPLTKEHLGMITMLVSLRLGTEHLTVEEFIKKFEEARRFAKLGEINLN